MSQPSYQSAVGYVGENFFTLLFDVALDATHPPLLPSFAIQINGTPESLSSVTVNSTNKTVTLSLSTYTLLPGDIIDFVYTDPSNGNDVSAIQDTSGIDAASIVNSIIIAVSRPGPAAPSTPVLAPASDSGTLGDSITSDTTPTVTGTAAANAVINLYDNSGTVLVGTTTADVSGNWTITSSTLSAGSHTLQATQTDSSNSVSVLSSGIVLTIDTQAAPPTNLGLKASSDSGTLGDGITNSATPIVTGQSEAGAGVKLYTNNGTTLLGTTTADGSGNWSITSSTLTEGEHTLTAIQTDKAGNVSLSSNGFSYVLDTIGPTAMALSTTQVSSSQANAGSTVATLQSTDNTAVVYDFAVGNGTIDADNGKFSISGNSLVADSNLSSGTYHIYLSATDAAGNSAFQIFSVTVADMPAVTSIVRAGSSSNVPASATSVDYTVTFSEAVTGVDANDFALLATGSATGTIQSIIDSGGGNIYTVTVGNISGDGTLRLDLKASGTGIANGSSVGISGGYTVGATYTLDHTLPAAPSSPVMSAQTDTGLSPTDGITSNTTPTFTGTGEEGSTVTLYDTGGTTAIGTGIVTGGNWTITPTSTLAAGTHTLTVKQTDAAGNQSLASPSKTVVIDTSTATPAAPTLAPVSDSGVQNDNITRINTPIFTGTAEANAVVNLYDTDGTTIVGTTTANGSGLWSITSSALSDAVHTLTVKQTDTAGNVSVTSSGRNITIDTSTPVAPATPLLSVASDSGILGDGITSVARPVVSGSAAAHAGITLYDSNGTTVLGTTTADGSGNWSITSSTLALGMHNLTVKQTNIAGSPSAASTSLDLTIIAAPSVPTTPGTSQTVDGVQITQQSVILPGGGNGTQVSIPIVTSDRTDASGNALLADIPLVTSGSGNLLQAQLATGFGLTASGGPSQPAGDSLQHLIQAILAATPGNTANDQTHLTSNGTTFLAKLAASTSLLVETIVPVGTTGNAPAGALTLTGTSTSEQHTALVIDTTNLPAQSNLQLNAVDFAAIIGSANVTGNTNGQVLTGDAASQQFTVQADSASSVFAGAGSDTLVVSNVASNNVMVDNTSTVIHGGRDNDLAVFTGASSDYDVQFHEGHVVVIDKAQPSNQTVIINAENLTFSDTTMAIQSTTTQTTLAGLYQEILGRQADYQGFEYWANEANSGASLGGIAISIINSTESNGLQKLAFNGNNSNDIEVLYQSLFGRASDAGGLAYWTNAMEQGMTLEQVAQSFATASEMATHQINAQGWDFIV